MKGLMCRLGLSETARIMCGVIAGLFAGLLAAGLLVALLVHPFERPLPYALGLALGCALSLTKVVLLERALEHAADLGDGKAAKNYGNLMALARYGLTVAVLLGVVFFPGVFGLFGVIFGILTLQISAYAASHVLRKRERQKSAE